MITTERLRLTGTNFRICSKTSCVCKANSRVGDTIRAPTSFFFHLAFSERRNNNSTAGIKKASVLPEP